MPLRVHIVSHTHWDREWYQPLGRFRQRLVELVDELLDDPPAMGESFLLDGQGIVLEDYLAVRPERRAELATLLREGRLEAGPWHVLADELIPSGEALVRNLLAGRRTLRALRAEAPPVLYCPDSFGHPATLPLLARGFGLEAVLLWRGYGGRSWPARDAAWWRAPDGSRALLLHLPPDGYEFGSSLPTDPEQAWDRWQAMREVLGARASLGTVLVHNGADHHARQLGHDRAIRALVEAAQPDEAGPSSLRGFVEDALARAEDASLPDVEGELRDSYGYAWTLQGTFAARAHQKRANALVERLLVRDAEPWAAIARARGGRSRRAHLHAAWGALLACHPHDTLCGCSIDHVARAAEARWEDARVQGEGIREDAVHDVAGHDPAGARTRRDLWKPVALVRNAAARPRAGLAWLEVDTFLADVGVGPGSARQRIVHPPHLPPAGLPLHHQVLRETVVHSRTESPRHYPDDDLVVRREVVALVEEVPGYGIRPVELSGGAAGRLAIRPVELSADGRGLDNGILRVRVDVRGSIALEAEGRVIAADLLGLECREDRGDLYTASLRGAPTAVRAVGVTTVHEGPLHAAIAVDWTVENANGGEPTTVTTTISLDAGAPFLRIAVAGVHRGEDQRIRLLVRTGVPGAKVVADAAFGAVERRPLALPADVEAMEVSPPTAPLHRYVSLFGDTAGATLYSDGLAEYEALHDGTVAVTLVRAVGELSRTDLPERPGHAGWPATTPGAQCTGPFAAELALLLHEGTRDAATIDRIERIADDVLLPLTGTTLRSALEVPAVVAGAALEGEGLAFSTLKESDDGAWTVARCVNLTGGAVEGAWRFGFAIAGAMEARLDETPAHPLVVEAESVVRFAAPPRAVTTILVR